MQAEYQINRENFFFAIFTQPFRIHLAVSAKVNVVIKRIVRQVARKKDIEELFRLYYKPLCLYAAKYLPDSDVVEDVVQEAFIAYWLKVQEGKAPEYAKSYLYKTVHNKCIDVLKNLSDDEALRQMEVDTVDDDNESRSFVWARLWAAIDSLPKKRKEVLLLNKRDGMSYSEIASKLGISENTVHNHITKALKTLREGAKKVFFFFLA